MKWINVKKRLPKNHNEVLVFAPNCDIIGNVLVGKYFAPEKDFKESWTVYDFGESALDEKVTHWMPLPNEPAT